MSRHILMILMRTRIIIRCYLAGFPIQSRELTTLQSILQGQIEKFGQHFFKEGSMVVPGGIFYDNRYFAVRIDPTFLNIPVSAYLSSLKQVILRFKVRLLVLRQLLLIVSHQQNLKMNTTHSILSTVLLEQMVLLESLQMARI